MTDERYEREVARLQARYEATEANRCPAIRHHGWGEQCRSGRVRGEQFCYFHGLYSRGTTTVRRGQRHRLES